MVSNSMFTSPQRATLAFYPRLVSDRTERRALQEAFISSAKRQVVIWVGDVKRFTRLRKGVRSCEDNSTHTSVVLL